MGYMVLLCFTLFKTRNLGYSFSTRMKAQGLIALRLGTGNHRNMLQLHFFIIFKAVIYPAANDK